MISSRRWLRGGISTPRDNAVNDGGRWSCALQMSHAVHVVRAAGCPAVVRHDRATGRPSCHVVERPQQTRYLPDQWSYYPVVTVNSYPFTGGNMFVLGCFYPRYNVPRLFTPFV